MPLGIVNRSLQLGVNLIPGPDGYPIEGSSPCSRNHAQGMGWIPCNIDEDLSCDYCGRPSDHSKTLLIDGTLLSRCKECARVQNDGIRRLSPRVPQVGNVASTNIYMSDVDLAEFCAVCKAPARVELYTWKKDVKDSVFFCDVHAKDPISLIETEQATSGWPRFASYYGGAGENGVILEYTPNGHTHGYSSEHTNETPIPSVRFGEHEAYLTDRDEPGPG